LKLEGRVALVTGSGRNIGRATVLKLASEGADVIVNVRSNEAEAQAVADEAAAMGVRSLAIVADVGDPAQVDRMMETAFAEFGRVDILINNAAIRPSKSFMELTMADWEQVRAVVLDGALNCTRQVVPAMVKNGFGRVLFLLGDGAFQGANERAHTSAAKMGLVGLARGLAKELAPHNIRVNLVSPGIIGTSREQTTYTPVALSQTPGPLGRLGSVDDIASACLFLVSEDSGFITGQTLHVNGGAGILG